MSLRYKIMRARVRDYTPAQAGGIAMLVGGAIVVLGLLLGAAVQNRAAGSERAAQWPAPECSVLGCGRAEV